MLPSTRSARDFVENAWQWRLYFFLGKIRNFNDFSIRKITVELDNDGCGQGTFWLRQEGTHVSYRQSSIISGGHIVRSSRGTGASDFARPKAEPSSKRLANGPTASSSFTVRA
jgi:hypothetical protein